MRNTNRQNGQALFTAMIFLIALTFMGFGLVSVATMDIHSSRNLRLAEEALSAAEEGALFAMAYAPTHTDEIKQAKLTNQPISLNSVTDAGRNNRDRLQYDVDIEVGDVGGRRQGYSFNYQFCLINIQSTGQVSDNAAFTFGVGRHSMVQRQVEVIAQVLYDYVDPGK